MSLVQPRDEPPEVVDDSSLGSFCDTFGMAVLSWGPRLDDMRDERMRGPSLLCASDYNDEIPSLPSALSIFRMG